MRPAAVYYPLCVFVVLLFHTMGRYVFSTYYINIIAIIIIVIFEYF